MAKRNFADENENAAPEGGSEQELPPPAPESSRPGDPQATTLREKAMAATTPGTEYWLP